MTTGYIDLDAPWGPFSTTYIGISNVLNDGIGGIADFALFTGRKSPEEVVLPDSIFDYTQNVKTGERTSEIKVIPENVSEDYSSYALKYFIDDNGDTALAKFKTENSSEAVCDITFKNSSSEEREYFYGLGVIASDIRRRVSLQEKYKPYWLAGRDYTGIEAYQKVFGLGCAQCLTRVFSWGVEPEILAQAFGGWEGDRVSFKKTLPCSLKDGFIYLRYIKYGTLEQEWEIKINGQATRFSFPQTWEIPGGGWGKNRDEYEEWRLLRVRVGEISEEELNIELYPVDYPGNDLARIWLDGIVFSNGMIDGDNGEDVLLPTNLVDEISAAGIEVEFDSADGNESIFKIINSKTEKTITVVTDEALDYSKGGEGSFLNYLRNEFNMPKAKTERDLNITPWGMVKSSPVKVAAGSEKTVSFKITINPSCDAQPCGDKKNIENYSELFSNSPYQSMINCLRDVLLYNVNYPINLFGKDSAYFVPSKFFSIPYSWDSGLDAVGMASFAPELALEQAAFFLADEDCSFPFLYCGSPVPTQFYALWQVYQETCDVACLEKTYAGIKRMYDFYIGRYPGSLVNEHNDGRLSTYPYNYNLGIDDHPIQRWAEENQVTKNGLYSIILMAQMLRIARIMRNIAHLLKKCDDENVYSEDVAMLENVVEGEMWDEESGLYGWLMRKGQSVERVELGGSKGDMSACAFFPLFSGQVTHKDRLIQILKDKERFLTPFGISSVDMGAPYYNPNGYWNGGIWPVMHWFIWRGLLEAGELEVARDVAERIMRTWQDSFDKGHYLGEHFMIAKEEMNGAPNFGGLSAILINLHDAYYKKYKVTTCFDVIVLSCKKDESVDSLELELTAPFASGEECDVLVNMGQGGRRYAVEINNRNACEYTADKNGHFSFRVANPGKDICRIIIKPV